MATGSIQIRVRDQNGDGVSGARLTQRVQGSTSYIARTTNSTGNYTFTGTVGTKYEFELTPCPASCTCGTTKLYHTITTSSGLWMKFTVNKAISSQECAIQFVVKEEGTNNAISNIVCRVGGKTGTTDSNGRCTINVPCDNSVTATIESGGDYECVDCSYGPFTPTYPGESETFYLKKETTVCYVDVRVLDQNTNTVPGVVISIPNAEGSDDKTTNSNGMAEGFELISGKQYYRTIKTVPSGFTATSMTTTFSTTSDATYTMYVNDADGCVEGETRSPTTCDDGSIIYTEKCENNKWVATGKTCPEAPEVETAEITDIVYPEYAHEGSDVQVVVSAKNTGTKWCELQVRLIDVELDNIINTEPELFVVVTGGNSTTQTLNTTGAFGRTGMPKYDWKLRVELHDRGVDTCIHETRDFTIKYKCPEVEAKFEITAPWRDSDQTECGIGESIKVGDTSISEVDIESCVWDWGDGHVSEGDKGFWEFLGADVFKSEHEYGSAGDKTIKMTATNECGSTDSQSFHITILTPADIESYITAPETAKVGEPFTVRVNNADEGTAYDIKVKKILLDSVIGEGTITSSGYVDITCIIYDIGDYEIYGYDPGYILNGYLTPYINISITETGDDPDDPDDPVIPDDIPDGTFQIAAPMFMVGEAEVHGRAPAGVEVKICGKNKWFGMDFMKFDTVLTTVISDSEGRFNTVVEFDEFGIVEIYAKITKEFISEGDTGFWAGVYNKYISGLFGAPTLNDWLVKDWYSNDETIYVLTWTVIIAVAGMMALLLEKQFNYIGIFKRR